MEIGQLARRACGKTDFPQRRVKPTVLDHATMSKQDIYWDLNYREAAIYLEEGWNNDKLTSHPKCLDDLRIYHIIHSKWVSMLDLTACVLLLALAFIEPPTDGQVQVNQSWRSRLSWSLFYNHVHLFFVGTFLGAHYYRNHCLDGYRSGKCFKNALVRLENFYPLPEVYGEMRNSSRHASGSNRYSDRTNDIFPGDARLASHISIRQLLLLWLTTLSSTGKWPARSLHRKINTHICCSLSADFKIGNSGSGNSFASFIRHAVLQRVRLLPLWFCSQRHEFHDFASVFHFSLRPLDNLKVTGIVDN